MEADEVCCDLMNAGFDNSKIDESVGTEGLEFLDPDGVNHGFLTKVVRTWQRVAQGEELAYLKRVKASLKEGHVVLSVPALTDIARGKVTEILQSHHAQDIRFYGRFHVEHL
jgi:hypothetical protein